MSFAGRVIWVTGASSGIGEALALALARRGGRLILSARRREELERVRAACHDGGAHQILPLDLAAADTLAGAAREALGCHGHLDIVIHNAGVSQRSLARETAVAVDRAILETNFFGTVALTKAVLPAMIERGEGHFVVITSLVGKVGTPLRSGYAASKHALHGFFDSLRAEEWRHGIRVTLACPGFVRTNVSINALTADGSAQGSMDRAQERGYAPERCAADILRAVARGKDEVLIGGREKYAVALKRFFPSLFNRVIRKASVT